MSWQAIYDSPLQGLYGLIAVPLLFLIYRAVRGRPAGGAGPAGAGFVDGYAIAFAIQTIIDPLVGGPLVHALGLADGIGATAALVFFVLLGDFRVYLLIFALLAIARGRAWSTAIAPAAAWTLIVPLSAYATNTALHAAVDGISSSSIWPIYESFFTVVAIVLRGQLPRRAAGTPPALLSYLQAMLLYVIAYYALWVLSDLLIQIAGIDRGWLLRMVPNQLYYGLWVPVAFFAFFSRRYHSTSASTHAAR